jgi:hypothetical protein
VVAIALRKLCKGSPQSRSVEVAASSPAVRHHVSTIALMTYPSRTIASIALQISSPIAVSGSAHPARQSRCESQVLYR